MPALDIRELQLTELSNAAHLVHICSGTDAEVTKAIYERQLRRGVGLLLGARRADALVGVARVLYFSPPANSPPNVAPRGWYLMGVNVLPSARAQGVGRQLTERRIDWLAPRTRRAYYFTRANNEASLGLHSAYGFSEVTRDFTFPTARLEGESILFKLEPLPRRQSAQPPTSIRQRRLT